jgi:hypothetical protein
MGTKFPGDEKCGECGKYILWSDWRDSFERINKEYEYMRNAYQKRIVELKEQVDKLKKEAK